MCFGPANAATKGNTMTFFFYLGASSTLCGSAKMFFGLLSFSPRLRRGLVKRAINGRISLGLSSPQARCRSWTWYKTCPKAVQEYRL